MEFWGVEIKQDETVKYNPGENKILHLSQVSLGVQKKDKQNENVMVFVKVNNQKLVLGTLSGEKCPQISYDLIFEKEFELSHNSKNATVHFIGYLTQLSQDEYSDSEDMDSDEEMEAIPLGLSTNGKPEGKEKEAKPEDVKAKADASASASKKKVLAAQEPKKGLKEEDDSSEESSDEDGSDDEEDGSAEDDSDKEMVDEDDDGEEDDEDESDEEDEATPKKADGGKKRSAEAVTKTPVAEKKAKLATPLGGQKTGGDVKKAVHVATPHPAKQAGKTPANSAKSKQQSPKSGASVTCKSCSKSFSTEMGLQAHSKAKHGAAK